MTRIIYALLILFSLTYCGTTFVTKYTAQKNLRRVTFYATVEYKLYQ